MSTLESREHYARLIASDEPIRQLTHVGARRDPDHALTHVIDGFHRAANWDCYCNRGNVYPITVNVIIDHRLGLQF